MFKKIYKNSFLSGVAIYFIANLFAAVLPFVLLPVLTRFLTPQEYGVVAIFQALLIGLSSFIGIGSQGIASIKYYENELTNAEMKIFIGNCFFVLVATAFLTLLATVLFGGLFVAWLGVDYTWLLLSSLVSSASFVISMRMTQWQIRKNSMVFGFFLVLQSASNVLLSLAFVIYLSQGLFGRLVVLCFVPIVFSLFALYSLYKDDILGYSWRPQYLREIFKFGVPLIPHSVGFFLLSSVDRFIINDKLGLSQVGIYMVAVQLVAVMGLVFDAINNAYVPWLFERLKRDQMEEKKQIVRWTYLYCIALLGVVALAFIIGPPLLILIAGENYSAATEIIGWLALGQAFNGMYLMVTNYIFYSKRTALLSLSTITAGLINVGLLLFLISLMGIKGAAMAYAISMALKLLMTWFIANMRHPMPWFNLKIRN